MAPLIAEVAFKNSVGSMGSFEPVSTPCSR